jgi:hypothetical protein
MAYRVRWEGHGVYRRFYGTVSPSDLKAACLEIAADPRYENIRYVLSDFLEAQPVPDFTEREAAALLRLELNMFFDSPDIVNAAVASDDKVLACVPYAASARLAPCPFGVFSSVAEARNWIAANPRLAWLGNTQASGQNLSHA